MPHPDPQTRTDGETKFRILAAVEDLPGEVATLRRALRWQRAFSGSLDVLRVIPESDSDGFDEEKSRSSLRDLMESADGGSDWSCEVTSGNAAQSIREFATALGADLLVLGRSAKPTLSDRWFGGVAESLLARPPCPMLLPGIHRDSNDEADPDRILLLSDASEASRTAFPLATRAVDAFGASLTVVHVCPAESLPGEREYERHGPAIDSLRREREVSFSRWLGEKPGMLPKGWNFQILEGLPSEAACRYAAVRRADLIILATRGTSGWRGLTGGTANRVARDAPCPVLLVPSSPFDD